MFKKWGLLMFVVLIGAVGLAACSSSNQSSRDTSNSDSGNSTKVEEITLTFVHWINEETGNWEPLIETYEAENPGVKIESVPLVQNMSSVDYFQQLDLLVSAGEKIDVIMFPILMEYARRVQLGLLEPLDSFMEDEGIDINEIYNNTYPAFDGHYFGLPMKTTTSLIMLNKDHLDEVGLEIPTDWTWDDYREYAKALTTEDRYGSFLNNWHGITSSLKLVGNKDNPTLFHEDGTSNADHPLVRESLELRYQLEQEDKSSVPLAETLSQNLNFRQQFFSQNASMIPTSSFMINEWGNFKPDFEIAWAPWPKNNPTDDRHYTTVAGDVIGIAKSSQHKQAAYDFIRWLSTEGITQQGIWVPAWNEADLESVLETMINSTSNPEAVHLESLKYTLGVTNPTNVLVPPAYNREATNEFTAQVELYLLGEQDIDTTVQNIQDRIQRIIDRNK